VLFDKKIWLQNVVILDSSRQVLLASAGGATTHSGHGRSSALPIAAPFP
jgi:hypothetical protein